MASGERGRRTDGGEGRGHVEVGEGGKTPEFDRTTEPGLPLAETAPNPVGV